MIYKTYSTKNKKIDRKSKRHNGKMFVNTLREGKNRTVVAIIVNEEKARFHSTETLNSPSHVHMEENL